MTAIAWAIVFAAVLLHGEWKDDMVHLVVMVFALSAVIVATALNVR